MAAVKRHPVLHFSVLYIFWSVVLNELIWIDLKQNIAQYCNINYIKVMQMEVFYGRCMAAIKHWPLYGSRKTLAAEWQL